jgi:NADPH:quinone reductase-like Zn-dependent oxidoreductase
MKAIALHGFGGPDVLSLQELPDPPVGPDCVLVAVRGAGVNPVDWKIREGYLTRGFPHHFPLIPGWDVAGVVAAVGPAVSTVAVGDEVMAYARKDSIEHGTYAEFVAVTDRAVALKPAALTFSQAAALPLAGLTALQALEAVAVGKGDRVLVHAAAGGVGHLAVQIARALGAEQVIGTASPGNHDFVRSLGATPVSYGDSLVDEVTALVGGDGRVDAVFDTVGGTALEQSARLVREAERHVSITDAQTVHAQGGRYVFVRPDGLGLSHLAELAERGALRVEVAREFPLAEAAHAHEVQQGGHVRGKLVLTV